MGEVDVRDYCYLLLLRSPHENPGLGVFLLCLFIRFRSAFRRLPIVIALGGFGRVKNSFRPNAFGIWFGASLEFTTYGIWAWAAVSLLPRALSLLPHTVSGCVRILYNDVVDEF